MIVVLHYVDKHDHVIERFLEILHVNNTIATTLKAAIDAMFLTYGLRISKLRGQEYDGVSNIQGQFNGLKALILSENPSAYYVHCFAQQVKEALVVVTKNHPKMDVVFIVVANICNVVGVSAKHQDFFKKHKLKIQLESDEIKAGRSLNHE